MKRAFLLAALLGAPAFAYNEAVHALLTRHALPRDQPVDPPTPEDLDAFRAIFWVRASEHPEFARRYPTIHEFGAWEFKEFLMLDPAARVHGFDRMPDDAAGTLDELLARASRWPDDDERNRHRYLRDGRTHEIVQAPDGSPLPYDPATLDFGSLTGTTSQGHAHYGLVEGPLSDDPGVLKKEPWRFAVPPTAHAYGPEFVRLYTDLARLAADSGLPSAVWLQAAFAGAAFHHLQDLCNQIHTVQVGIYEFFQAAFVQSKLRDLKTLGGVFGERHSLAQAGLRLIANHHLLSEDLLAKHFDELHLAIDVPDKEIAAAPDLARAIIDRSSREAPEVYRLAWRFSAENLRDGVYGHEYDGAKGDDPDAYVAHTPDADAGDPRLLRHPGARTPPRRHRRARMAAPLPGEAARSGPRPACVPRRRGSSPGRLQAGLDRPPRIAWGYPGAVAALVAGVALIWSRRSRRS